MILSEVAEQATQGGVSIGAVIVAICGAVVAVSLTVRPWFKQLAEDARTEPRVKPEDVLTITAMRDLFHQRDVELREMFRSILFEHEKREHDDLARVLGRELDTLRTSTASIHRSAGSLEAQHAEQARVLSDLRLDIAKLGRSE